MDSASPNSQRGLRWPSGTAGMPKLLLALLLAATRTTAILHTDLFNATTVNVSTETRVSGLGETARRDGLGS